MIIPLELWRVIAYELQSRKDRQSLMNLCLTSVALDDNIRPILYNEVELPTVPKIALFCRPKVDFATKLGPCIQTLTIGGYQSYRQWHWVDVSYLTESLSLVLKCMPNLRNLTIAITAINFTECFGPLSIKPPFSLQKLVFMSTGTLTFYQFLKSQPSIKELHIGSRYTLGEFEFSDRLSQQPDLLPNLTSIAAPIIILKGAVPGRPISRVAIVAELLDWTDPGMTIIAPGTWEALLCGSRAAITTIGLYQSPHSADPWDQLVPALKQFGVYKTLRSVHIMEALEPPVTDLSKQEALSQRVEQMQILRGFDRLESVEFGEMPYLPSPMSDVTRWLGGMDNLAAWQAHVPSLKQVKMYGINIS
ncbi:unnamed protein product [Rhizoctonia solani]|uniref:F-box domain-containing protein n=1 Tax=Rhizoctonia solani TaxID=456999 RepID=A0A8H2X3U6_9AGAM|nr:unnamed protein product [Rhizoctonia solani]